MRTLTPVVFVGAALLVARSSPAGSPLPADRVVAGEVQKRGAAYVAGSHGATYELKGGAVVELSPGTEFSFDPSIKLKLRKPSDPDTLTRALRVTRGTLEVTIPESRTESTAVMFRGPGKLSAVAKEGRAGFHAGPDRTSAIARSGEMLVGVGAEWKPLREGLARTLAPEDPTAIPRPVLPPPTVTTDKQLAVVPGAGTSGFSAKWATVKEADHYEASLLKLGSPRPELVSRLDATGGEASFSDLPPGVYGVSVASVDRQGVRGNASPPTVVRILGIEVPDGARSEGGVIILGRNQRVALRGAEGLEVAFGASQEFLAAPSAVGLAHNESTLVRFRVPGSKDEAALQLEPDRLRAKVNIGPRTAHWPDDRVTVEVELTDAGGRAIPDTSLVDAKVTVNLAPVNVKWTRIGQTLRGDLPVGSGAGPWVVRAEVKDHRGTLIGREFLEVAKSPTQERFSTAMR